MIVVTKLNFTQIPEDFNYTGTDAIRALKSELMERARRDLGETMGKTINY
jgi:hypothetical protein